MEKENNPIYERNTLEFVTVALEFCTFVENAGNTGLFDFLDKAVKILPLLYLKATLLPEAEEDEDAEPELTVTEDMYESVRNRIAGLLGEKDSYLETFHPDIASFVIECVYCCVILLCRFLKVLHRCIARRGVLLMRLIIVVPRIRRSFYDTIRLPRA